MQIFFCTRENIFGQREQPGYDGAGWDYWKLELCFAHAVMLARENLLPSFSLFRNVCIFVVFAKARGMRRPFMLCVRIDEDGVRTFLLNLETDTYLI